METPSNLAFGLGVGLSWQKRFIGPVATVAMLLPFTFGLGPAPALIMLAGIYYGQYGGSTTAILVNIPGENARSETTGELELRHRMSGRSHSPRLIYSMLRRPDANPLS
jgi:TctA family transporter